MPTFPNARYLMPRVDEDGTRAEGGPIYNESILPVIAAWQAESIGPDHRLGDHVALISTPGHVAVQVLDGGRKATITGDTLHSTIQC